MPTNNIISRTDAQALIPEQTANEIISNSPRESAALTLFRQVRMATGQTRLPIIAALPVAYFVNGDTGLKQTSEVNWNNKFLNAEELAVLVPIPEAVLDDASFDVWGEIRPLIEEAFGRALDAAIFFGTDKPATWPGAIVPDAVTAGNTVTRGTNAPAAGGIAQDFSDLFGTVEADGFDVNGLVASIAYRGRLRGARTSTGESTSEVTPNDVYGVQPRYVMRGLWPTGVAAAEAVAGDFTQGILGVRQDMTYKILDQAVIQNADGTIAYNLAQQDMVAMRVVTRVAFQIANVINNDNPGAGRYPFAVLRAA